MSFLFPRSGNIKHTTLTKIFQVLAEIFIQHRLTLYSIVRIFNFQVVTSEMNTERIKKRKNFIHENPFCCAVCRKIFVRKVGLRAHIRKTNHHIHRQWPESVQTILPQEWPYNVVSFSQNGSHYKIKIVLPSIRSADELRSWIDSYMRLNQCVYTRTGSKKNRSRLTPYSEFYRCQHFHPRTAGKRRTKGTGCKSSIATSIKCDYSNDPYYAAVIINFFHNHTVYFGDTLRFRKPSVEVEQIFQRMLLDGFNPAHALRNFMTHLELQPADHYVSSISDRTKCPDYNWVHHFSGKLFKSIRPSIDFEETLKNIKSCAENLNEELGSRVGCIEELANNDYAVSILTPLMKRGLENPVASEAVVVDSVNCVDKFGVNILLLSCLFNSTTRIPLGIIITSQETETILEQGWRLYLSMTEETSFGGRGQDGPLIFITDNSKILAKVLKTVFPQASFLWSGFHSLKNAYNWLLNSKYHVDKDDLGPLYYAIRNMIYSPDENTLQDHHREASTIYSCNPHVISYLKTLYEKRQKWAFCYRSPALKHNSELEKVLLLECQILKEEILNQVQNQSPDSLLRYFVVDYDHYFLKKLIDNCVDFNQNYFKKFANDVDAESYTFGPFLNSESLYYVYNKNKNSKYIVNADVGICTCYIGISGNFCRHQRLLMDTMNEQSVLQYPLFVEPKVELYYIATGSKEVSQTFFDSFHSSNNAKENTPYAFEVILKNDGSSQSNIIDNIEKNLDAHIIEEIVIEINHDDIFDSEEKEDLCSPNAATSPDSYQQLTSKNECAFDDLKESFDSFVAAIEPDVEFYAPGLQEMLTELKKLNNASAQDRLLALKSFNKCL